MGRPGELLGDIKNVQDIDADGALTIRPYVPALAIAASGGRDRTVSKRLECGIAMLHFELGARAMGLSGRWDFLPSPDVARLVLDGD